LKIKKINGEIMFITILNFFIQAVIKPLIRINKRKMVVTDEALPTKNIHVSKRTKK